MAGRRADGQRYANGENHFTKLDRSFPLDRHRHTLVGVCPPSPGFRRDTNHLTWLGIDGHSTGLRLSVLSQPEVFARAYLGLSLPLRCPARNSPRMFPFAQSGQELQACRLQHFDDSVDRFFLSYNRLECLRPSTARRNVGRQ